MLRSGTHSRSCGPVIAVLLALLAGPSLTAHVELDAPDGGETLVAGSVAEIRWHVVVQHNLENWDLWYSASGDGGPWIEIAVDLPPGDGSTGAVHRFDWLVPDHVSDDVRVRVQQDNSGQDWDDFSDASLSIVPDPDLLFADGFESGDADAWTQTNP